MNDKDQKKGEMTDREKRMEAIRRKKEALQKELAEKSANGAAIGITTPSTITSNSQPTSVSSSTTQSNNKSKGSISIITLSTGGHVDASPATSNKQIFDDPVKNAIWTEIYKKKLSQSLSTSQFSTNLIGIYPDTTEGFSQYEMKEEEKEKEKEKEPHHSRKEDGPILNRRASVRKASISSQEDKKYEDDKKKKKEMNEDARNEFIQKNEQSLAAFLNKEKDMFEKALLENDLFDICQTYYYEENSNVDVSKRTWVTPICEFYDDGCEGRVVTSLEWAQKQDQLLVGFSKSKDLNERDGLIMLWNLNNKKTAEYVIKCQTELTATILNRFNPNMIIASNYIGQLLIYDIKSKPIPINKTPLGVKTENEKTDKNSVRTHTLPISALALTGIETNNTLISLSVDGIMCTWSLANMSRPLNYIELKENKTEDKYSLNNIGPLSISYSPYQNNTVYLGSDSNKIYQISTMGGKNNSDVVYSYQGHQGPINCVDVHPGEAHHDLFLSSSSDWSTKLWNNNMLDPLISFDADDYVFATKWHPHNPSLFVNADGSGHLDFWDLNKDVEVPTFRYESKTMVNKLSWYHDGKKLATGDISGKVNILGLEKELYSTKPDDSAKFIKVINSIGSKDADLDD